MTLYQPTDWYWYVGGDTSQAYSSKVHAFVQPDDATFVAWLASGGVPTNIDTMDNLRSVVFPPVTPWRARAALLDAGLLDQVNTLVDQQSTAVKMKWEFASEVRRDDPLIASLAGSLGLTAEQIDALFIQARTYT